MIYFDNAATSFPKPPAVAQAMTAAIATMGSPSRGAHGYSLAADRCLADARIRLARLFNCPDPDRIAFTKNATEALNLAIMAVDGHIVSGEAEHNAVLRPLYRRGGYRLAPVDKNGVYDPDDLASLYDGDVDAVVLAHASNLTGNVVPITEIGRFCRERGLTFIVDAAQTAGLLPIDMEAMCIDVLCFTGHKSLYGVQGTGGICLGPRFTPRPLIVGGSGSRTFSPDQPETMPDRLEAGTQNAHGIAALAAGVRSLEEAGPETLRQRADRLARMFADGVRALDGAVLYGDYTAAERAPIVTLNLGSLDSAEAAATLWSDYGIAVRGGAHCAPLLHKRFGTERQGAVRFSFSHCNTEAEVERGLEALRHMLTDGR